MMPLLDHFHPPLAPVHQWSSFHASWATSIAGSLNKELPAHYFAAPNVHFNIEIDVAAMRRPGADWPDEFNALSRWQPSPPTATIPFAVTSDEVEILVFDNEGGATLVGAIELVSPANKNKPASRHDFHAKCQSYLKLGVGVLVVDLVTTRWTDLHAELLGRLDPPLSIEPIRSLAVTSYRPGASDLAIWRELLTLGDPLPTMPLWLRTGPSLEVDLEGTYQEVCRLLKLREA